MKQEKRRLELPVIGSGRQPALPHVEGGARVGVITLGCDKNTVDSERIMARLAGSGAQVSSDIEDADVIVINTCGFIDRAKEESIEAMLDAVKLKQQGRVKAVVAMGCLVQRYKQDLVEEIPEIDAFLGLTEAEQGERRARAAGGCLAHGAAAAAPQHGHAAQLLPQDQ
jgi:ribosomal protein S12 methylthiotransferase